MSVEKERYRISALQLSVASVCVVFQPQHAHTFARPPEHNPGVLRVQEYGDWVGLDHAKLPLSVRVALLLCIDKDYLRGKYIYRNPPVLHATLIEEDAAPIFSCGSRQLCTTDFLTIE